MMQDYDRTLELIDAAQNSTGKSTEQFTKYQDTLEAKINTLKTTWEQLRTSDSMTSFLKNVVDKGNEILQIANKLNPKALIAQIVAGILTIRNALKNVTKGASFIGGAIDRKFGTGGTYNYTTGQIEGQYNPKEQKQLKSEIDQKKADIEELKKLQDTFNEQETQQQLDNTNQVYEDKQNKDNLIHEQRMKNIEEERTAETGNNTKNTNGKNQKTNNIPNANTSDNQEQTSDTETEKLRREKADEEVSDNKKRLSDKEKEDAINNDKIITTTEKQNDKDVSNNLNSALNRNISNFKNTSYNDKNLKTSKGRRISTEQQYNTGKNFYSTLQKSKGNTVQLDQLSSDVSNSKKIGAQLKADLLSAITAAKVEALEAGKKVTNGTSSTLTESLNTITKEAETKGEGTASKIGDDLQGSTQESINNVNVKNSPAYKDVENLIAQIGKNGVTKSTATNAIKNGNFSKDAQESLYNAVNNNEYVQKQQSSITQLEDFQKSSYERLSQYQITDAMTVEDQKETLQKKLSEIERQQEELQNMTELSDDTEVAKNKENLEKSLYTQHQQTEQQIKQLEEQNDADVARNKQQLNASANQSNGGFSSGIIGGIKNIANSDAVKKSIARSGNTAGLGMQLGTTLSMSIMTAINSQDWSSYWKSSALMSGMTAVTQLMSGQWVAAIGTVLITALGGAVALIKEMQKQAKDFASNFDISNEKKALEDYKESLKTAVDTATADVTEQKEKSQTLDDIVDTYNKLNGKVKLTDEEQEKYDTMVTNVKEQFPELLSSYDAANNKITLNLQTQSQIKETLDQQIEQLVKQQTYEQILLDITNQRLNTFNTINTVMSSIGNNTLGQNLYSALGEGDLTRGLDAAKNMSVDEQYTAIENDYAAYKFGTDAGSDLYKNGYNAFKELMDNTSDDILSEQKNMTDSVKNAYKELITDYVAYSSYSNTNFTDKGNEEENISGYIDEALHADDLQADMETLGQLGLSTEEIKQFLEGQNIPEKIDEAKQSLGEKEDAVRAAIENQKVANFRQDISTQSQAMSSYISSEYGSNSDLLGAANPLGVLSAVNQKDLSTDIDISKITVKLDNDNKVLTDDLINNFNKNLESIGKDAVDFEARKGIYKDNGKFREDSINSNTFNYDETKDKNDAWRNLYSALGITDEKSFEEVFGSATPVMEDLAKAIDTFNKAQEKSTATQELFNAAKEQGLLPGLSSLSANQGDYTFSEASSKYNSFAAALGKEAPTKDELEETLGIQGYIEKLQGIISDTSTLTVTEIQTIGSTYDNVLGKYQETFGGNSEAAEAATKEYFKNIKDTVESEVTDSSYQDKITEALYGLDPSTVSDMDMSTATDTIKEKILAACPEIGEDAAESISENIAQNIDLSNLGINLSINSETGVETALDTLQTESTDIVTNAKNVIDKLQDATTGEINATDLSTIDDYIEKMGLVAEDYHTIDSTGKHIGINTDKLIQDVNAQLSDQEAMKQSVIEQLKTSKLKVQAEKDALKGIMAQIKAGDTNRISLVNQAAAANQLSAELQAGAIAMSQLKTGNYNKEDYKDLVSNFEAQYATKFGAVYDEKTKSYTLSEDAQISVDNLQEQIDEKNTEIQGLDDEIAKVQNGDYDYYFKDLPEALKTELAKELSDKKEDTAEDDKTDDLQDDVDDAKEAVDDAKEDIEDAKESVEEAAKSLKEAKEGTDDWVESIENLINYTTRLTNVQQKLTNNETALKEVDSISDAYKKLSDQAILRGDQTNLLIAENDKYEDGVREGLQELQTREWEGQSYSNFVQQYDDGTFGIDALGLQNAKIPDDVATEIKELVDDMNSYTTDILKNENTIAELEQTRLSEHKEYLSDYVSLQDKVAETLKNNAEDEIETEKNKYSAMEEAQNDYLDALEKAINKQKELRSEEQSYNNLAQEEAKLSLMERDTSNSNSSTAEIAEQRQQVQNDRQTLLDDKVDNIVSNLKDIYDTQKEERDALLEIKEKVISDADENNAFTEQAAQIVANFGSVEDVQAWFLENDSNLNGKTVEAVEKEMLDIKDTTEGALKYQAEQQIISDGKIETSITSVEDYLTTTAETMTGDASRRLDTAEQNAKDAIADAQKSYDDALSDLQEKIDTLAEKEDDLTEATNKLSEAANTVKTTFQDIKNGDDDDDKDKSTSYTYASLSKMSSSELKTAISNIQSGKATVKGYTKNQVNAALKAYEQSGKTSAFTTSLANVNKSKKDDDGNNDDGNNNNKQSSPPSFSQSKLNIGKTKSGVQYIEDTTGKHLFMMGNYTAATSLEKMELKAQQAYANFRTDYSKKNKSAISEKGKGYKIGRIDKIYFRVKDGALQIADTKNKWKNTGISVANAYAQGGLVDFTGPAWVDGTKSKPEAFLSSSDTQNIQSLTTVLSSLFDKVTTNSSTASDIANTITSNTQNNGENTFNINLDIGSISDDYDVEDMVSKMKEEIVKAANPIGANTILNR